MRDRPRAKIKRPFTTAAAAALSALIAAFAAPGCAPSDGCRYDPVACGGDVGAICTSDAECASGYCCTERSNCGGGMCTIPCADDLDCPGFMACEHQVCFFRCELDEDCAVGQSCEHGNTICEWP